MAFCISQDKEPPLTLLPLVPGCSCYKPETPAVSRCYGGHAGCGWGLLEAGARKEREEVSKASKKTKASSPTFLMGRRERMAKPS